MQEVRDTTSHRVLAKGGRLRDTKMAIWGKPFPDCRREVAGYLQLSSQEGLGDMHIRLCFSFHRQPQCHPLEKNENMKITLFDLELIFLIF